METGKPNTVSTRRTLTQEKLDALVRTQAMRLFRQQGLHFTMQQVAEPLHISKKTIYTVYPSKEALLLDMVDHAFAEIHRCKQEILAGGGTLQEKLRAVIIAMPAEYAALDLRQMKELDEKYPVVAARVRWWSSFTMPYSGTSASAVPASASFAALTCPLPPSISKRSGFCPNQLPLG